MVRDFSCSFQGKQSVRGRQLRMGSGGFLRKAVGVVITCAMFCGLGASVALGWMIRSGLSELSYKANTRVELLKEQEKLAQEKSRLLARANIEVVAAELDLYPMTAQQVRRY